MVRCGGFAMLLAAMAAVALMMRVGETQSLGEPAVQAASPSARSEEDMYCKARVVGRGAWVSSPRSDPEAPDAWKYEDTFGCGFHALTDDEVLRVLTRRSTFMIGDVRMRRLFNSLHAAAVVATSPGGEAGTRTEVYERIAAAHDQANGGASGAGASGGAAVGGADKGLRKWTHHYNSVSASQRGSADLWYAPSESVAEASALIATNLTSMLVPPRERPARHGAFGGAGGGAGGGLRRPTGHVEPPIVEPPTVEPPVEPPTIPSPSSAGKTGNGVGYTATTTPDLFSAAQKAALAFWSTAVNTAASEGGAAAAPQHTQQSGATATASATASATANVNAVHGRIEAVVINTGLARIMEASGFFNISAIFEGHERIFDQLRALCKVQRNLKLFYVTTPASLSSGAPNSAVEEMNESLARRALARGFHVIDLFNSTSNGVASNGASKRGTKIPVCDDKGRLFCDNGREHLMQVVVNALDQMKRPACSIKREDAA